MIKINWLLTIIAVLLIVMLCFLAYLTGYIHGENQVINNRYEQESRQMTDIIKKMNNPTLKLSHNSERYVTIEGIVSEDENTKLKQLLQEQFGNTYPLLYRLQVEVKR